MRPIGIAALSVLLVIWGISAYFTYSSHHQLVVEKRKVERIIRIHTGPRGKPGEVGPAGIQGFPGQQGPQGLRGVRGVQGQKGNTGLTGSRGPQGERGITGKTGAQGERGPTGSTGARGITGQRGAQGLRGATGATGHSICPTGYHFVTLNVIVPPHRLVSVLVCVH